LPAEAKPCSSD